MVFTRAFSHPCNTRAPAACVDALRHPAPNRATPFRTVSLSPSHAHRLACRVSQVDREAVDDGRSTNGTGGHRLHTSTQATRPGAAPSTSHGSHDVLSLLQQVAAGNMAPETAAVELANHASGIQALKDFALLDVYAILHDTHHLPAHCMDNIHRGRQARTGTPELVWGPGKTSEHIAAILRELATRQHTAMATRIEPTCAHDVQQLLPDAVYNPVARTLTYRDPGCAVPKARLPGTVAVVAAGTSDLAVVEEVKAVAELMGCYCFKITDCGVAGLHRVLSKLDSLRSADVVIVAAGMDGALPSVLSGLVAAPVIAVPTSVGYGAAFQGVAPLLTALNSCSPGVTVVNIDNGVGAAVTAARMLAAVQRRCRILQEATGHK